MRSCGISSQLEKFSSLVGIKTRWDEICQSQSRPVYASGIKKISHSRPYIFLWDKNMSQSHPKWDGILWDPILLGKLSSQDDMSIVNILIYMLKGDNGNYKLKIKFLLKLTESIKKLGFKYLF